MNHDNDNQPLRFLSVCSGIEAASVAWPQWEAVAFSEIEKFPSAVLAHHYPDVPNLGDFTKIDTTTLGRVDILCGGTPCQAFSVAGLRGGLDDARGNLTLKFVELAHELAGLGRTAGNGLRNVVWENVVGVLSDKGNAFGCFLGGLVGADAAIEPPTRGKWGGAGLVSGPKGRAAWRVCDAQFWGVAQRRRRVIVVADFGNGADPAEVLFEREGVQRHTPPSREKGEGVAGAAAQGFGSSGDTIAWSIMPQNSGKDYKARPVEVAQPLMAGGPVGGNQGGDFIQQPVSYAPEIARCVATREGSSQDYETTTMLAVSVTGDVAHTLKAEGADASEDGTGRGTPIVAFDTTQITSKANRSNPQPGDPCHPLSAGAHPPAITVAIRGREGGATAEIGGEIATALRASQGGGDKPHVLAFGWQNSEYQGDSVDEHITPTLDKSKTPAVLTSAVRRLTPVECERLQGFPDEYTAIPWRGKPADQCPDGPRYKALGNSWAVPLFAWLGRRIDMHMPSVATLRTADNDNKQEASIAARTAA